MSSTNLPEHVQTLLYAGGDWRLPGDDDKPCEGAVYHSPRPLFTKPTMLVRREWWAADDAEDRPQHAYWVMAPDAWLCGVCRDNLDILLQIIHRAGSVTGVDWPVRREFGNDLRGLAVRGWHWFEAHHLGKTDLTKTAP